MAPGARSKFGVPIFAPEVFRKQMYCIEYLRHCSDFTPPPAVIRRPGNCAPPRYAPGWSCSSQLWYPRRLRCDCLSNSCIVEVNYEKERDNTHPIRSPTATVNGFDLTLPTRLQTSEQDYSDLTASNRRPLTPYSRNTLQSFSRGTRSYAFPRSAKHMWTSFAYSQDFSKTCWWVTFGLQCYGRDENRTGYHSALVQLFRGIFLSRHLAT